MFNLEQMKFVINHPDFSDMCKRDLIIEILSHDDMVMIRLIELLSAERKRKKELILDLSNELCKSEIYISRNKQTSKRESKFLSREEVLNDIDTLYKENQNSIRRNYNKKSTWSI